MHLWDQPVIVAVVPVVDGEGPGAQLGFPHRPLGGVGVGEGELDRPLPPDGKFQRELAGAVLRILPQRPGPARQRGQERALVGDELVERRTEPRVAEDRLRLGGQFAPQASPPIGVPHRLPLREAGLADGRAARLLLHALEVAGSAAGAGPLDERMEQAQQHQRQILAGLEFTAGILFGAGLAALVPRGLKAALKLAEEFPVSKRGFAQSAFAGNGCPNVFRAQGGDFLFQTPGGSSLSGRRKSRGRA